jgi:hypothetical protein
MGIAATVSSAPTNAADTLDLHWLSPRDGADGEEVVRERDLRWVATSQLPAVGDDVGATAVTTSVFMDGISFRYA